MSVRKALPLSPGVKTTWAPNGALASTCRRTASMASAGSWPGASRRLNLARARGRRVLEATSTAGASKPMMDSAGLVHIREAMRAGAGEPDAVEHGGVGAVFLLR